MMSADSAVFFRQGNIFQVPNNQCECIYGTQTFKVVGIACADLLCACLLY